MLILFTPPLCASSRTLDCFFLQVPTAKKAEREAPPPSRVGVIFFVVVITLGALGAWFWSSHRTGSGSGSGSDLGGLSGGSRAVKSSLHLETFVLNLADPEPRSYLRVGIDLGLSREMGRGENAPPVSAVRDTILGVLAQCRVDDLLTAKGKEKLKDDLLHALQAREPGLGVEEIYFTEFLIQR